MPYRGGEELGRLAEARAGWGGGGAFGGSSIWCKGSPRRIGIGERSVEFVWGLSGLYRNFAGVALPLPVISYRVVQLMCAFHLRLLHYK